MHFGSGLGVSELSESECVGDMFVVCICECECMGDKFGCQSHPHRHRALTLTFLSL